MCDQSWCYHPSDLVRCAMHGDGGTYHIQWMNRADYRGWICFNGTGGSEGHKITDRQRDAAIEHWRKARKERTHESSEPSLDSGPTADARGLQESREAAEPF